LILFFLLLFNNDHFNYFQLRYKFEKYGPLRRCDLMNGFAFLEYEEFEDARYAVKKMNGYEMDGREWLVEFSRDKKTAAKGSGVKGGGVRDKRNCLKVTGLASRTSWRELKDWARGAGNIEYADVWVDDRGENCGVIKYADRDDFKKAQRSLDDTKLDGVRVRVEVMDEDDGSSRRSRTRSRSPRRRSASRSPRRKSEKGDAPAAAAAGSRSASRSRSRSRSG